MKKDKIENIESALFVIEYFQNKEIRILNIVQSDSYNRNTKTQKQIGYKTCLCISLQLMSYPFVLFRMTIKYV